VVDARGGSIASWLYVTDPPAVDLNGALIGNADYTQDLVSVGGSGQLRLWNGNIRGNVSAGVASTVDLHGGTLDGYLRASDSSNVNIYGSVSSIEPAIAPGRFLMTGTWLDGVPFLLELYDSQTLSHINIMPEPSAFLILLAGCFLARTRRRAGQSPVQ